MGRCDRVDCPLCYSGAKGRQSFKGHLGWYAPKSPRRRVVAMLRRRSGDEKVNGQPVGIPADWAEYKATVEFLTATVWPDNGEPRQTGTLLVFCEDGHWKVMLNDRDQGLITFSTVDVEEGILETVEAVLTDDRTVWRVNRQKGGSRK